uniref:Protein kinase domain-containing protein n=1 Tax=Alexandrium monilatum TaxID=311494 RepID=A0A7S4QXX1_9DINO
MQEAALPGRPTSPGAALGDLGELRRRLAEERRRLQLFVVRARQGHEDRQDVIEDWEHEYCRPSAGQACGPQEGFVVEKELGKGVFATVFRCRQRGLQGSGACAVKFIRSNAMLRKAAEKEVSMLRRLRARTAQFDREGARFLLGLVGCETFVHENHLALVLELMNCDLRSGLQKYGQGCGLPLIPTLRNFARNIFMALRALQRANIIHGDVKPDNMLMSLDKSVVKLCDFGSAMDASEQIRTDYIQPRYYRAPEVILGQEYGVQIDTWSAGVTLFELATGLILFRGGSNNEMIHEMLKTTGAFGQQFALTGEFATKHFNDNGDFLNAGGDFRLTKLQLPH